MTLARNNIEVIPGQRKIIIVYLLEDLASVDLTALEVTLMS